MIDSSDLTTSTAETVSTLCETFMWRSNRLRELNTCGQSSQMNPANPCTCLETTCEITFSFFIDEYLEPRQAMQMNRLRSRDIRDSISMSHLQVSPSSSSPESGSCSGTRSTSSSLISTSFLFPFSAVHVLTPENHKFLLHYQNRGYLYYYPR